MSLLPLFTIPGPGFAALKLHGANAERLSFAPYFETSANALPKAVH